MALCLNWGGRAGGAALPAGWKSLMPQLVSLRRRRLVNAASAGSVLHASRRGWCVERESELGFEIVQAR
jgi:hypothetical protein